MNINLISIDQKCDKIGYAKVVFKYHDLLLHCRVCYNVNHKKWFVRLPFELHQNTIHYKYLPTVFFHDKAQSDEFQKQALTLISKEAPDLFVDNPKPLPPFFDKTKRKFTNKKNPNPKEPKNEYVYTGKARATSKFNLKK